MIVTCSCQHCGGHIEFESADFEPGTSFECPHCTKQTLLYVRTAPAGSTAARIVDKAEEERIAGVVKALRERLPEPTWASLAAAAAVSGTSLGGASPGPATPKKSIADQTMAGNPNIEETLETIGSVFLVIGIIGGILLGVAFLASLNSGQSSVEERIGLFCLAIICIAQGIIIRALLDALAEIIRLLRKNSK
jgi:hypothetical protein